MQFSPIHDAWYLAGPTASGKTAVGIELARRLDAEIVSMDSMAVYRGMDIGTAKPSTAERQLVPHHLIDIVDPNVDFSISDYLRCVHECVASIRDRDRKVLFVGGTPLYLKALVSGFDDGPDADWDLRKRLEAEAEKVGSQELHRQLAEIDPPSAAKLHPNDLRRIIRAIEFHQKTGKPISSVQQHFESGGEPSNWRIVALDWHRGLLHARINARALQMFEQGMVAEVRGLMSRIGRLGRTASQAVGYQEVLGHIAGEWSLEVAIERTQARSRQLARRQLIWLRSLSGCHWIQMSEPPDAAGVAMQIIGRFEGTSA